MTVRPPVVCIECGAEQTHRVCADCFRRDREDVSRQAEAVWEANTALTEALNAVIGEARAAKPSRMQPHTASDLTRFYAAVNTVRRAEEARDFALLDLAGATGEDT